MTDLAANLAAVEQRIAAACERSGRSTSDVRLIPVSKTHSLDEILAVYEAGYRRFGENKVQEAQAKAEQLSGVPDLSWAIIGHLQTNKAKYVVRFADEFQALDSVRIAAELDRRLEAAGRQLDVLIQVNTSGEASKFGLAPDEVVDFARGLQAMSALRVNGLMTMARHSDDPAVMAASFTQLADLREQLRNDDRLDGDYPELSMGMSNDFELAIEHGATCVRIGTAIFGARDYSAG